ncbi:hypothetical protein W292_02144, partial [Staphylococcus aureus DAR3179]
RVKKADPVDMKNQDLEVCFLRRIHSEQIV